MESDFYFKFLKWYEKNYNDVLGVKEFEIISEVREYFNRLNLYDEKFFYEDLKKIIYNILSWYTTFFTNIIKQQTYFYRKELFYKNLDQKEVSKILDETEKNTAKFYVDFLTDFENVDIRGIDKYLKFIKKIFYLRKKYIQDYYDELKNFKEEKSYESTLYG